MRTELKQAEMPGRAADGGGPAKRSLVVRRIEPWSVLKFSLVYYFCVMLIFLVALFILYLIMAALGILDSLAELLQGGAFGSRKEGFQFNGYWIFSRLFVVGVVGVLLWSLVKVVIAILYNRVSDVVGGIQITMAQKR